MPRKPATKASVLQMPASVNGDGPQPPDSPMNFTPKRMSVLSCVAESITYRWLRNPQPTEIQIARDCGLSRPDVERIVKAQIVERLRRAA